MPILRPAITLPLPRHPDGVPRLPPARETPFSPRALFTADLAGTRAPRKREKEAEGRPIYRARTAIIFEQLCVNSSYRLYEV